MPGALTHIMITWSLSPITSQVPGVTSYSVAGTPHGEVRDIGYGCTRPPCFWEEVWFTWHPLKRSKVGITFFMYNLWYLFDTILW
jgi:hypothetical protein